MVLRPEAGSAGGGDILPPAARLALLVGAHTRTSRQCCHSLPLPYCQAADINALFGFRLECLERLGDQAGLKTWQRLNTLFNWLPLAALIEDKVGEVQGWVGGWVGGLQGAPQALTACWRRL